jgi:probable phosphomutase (TIGR03848 family)
VTLVLLVRHGLTADTGKVLTGRTPGIPLDDRGREQASALAARLAAVPLDAIVTSPVLRCRQTADAIAAARNGHPVAVTDDEQLAEVRYGDWAGKPLRRLARDPLWRVVQVHPSAVRFPGEDGESMPDMQHRAVRAIRGWNDRLGADGVYLVCSHGDVIKSLIADSLGMHLDLLQRIQVDPCSLTVIRYTPLRPFLVRMNDTGGSVSGLVRPGRPAGQDPAHGQPDARRVTAGTAGGGRDRRGGRADGDAVIGGGAGG